MRRIKLLVSLPKQGAKHHLVVAITLVAIIPLLSFAYIAFNPRWMTDDAPIWPPLVITVIALFLAVIGYLMLRRYPMNIVKLRHYIEHIAAGDLSSEIRLEDPEDDLGAIERAMNTLLRQLRARVTALEEELTRSQTMQRTIEAQARELVEAERHRVMIESLGAACHHIGQPATVLRLYMDILKKQADTHDRAESLDQCEKAVDAIADILDKLRRVGEYRTVPYQTYQRREVPSDARIIDIGS